MTFYNKLKHYKYTISYSWASVLTFASFWCYGYMAAVPVTHFAGKCLLTVGLLLLTLFLFRYRKEIVFFETFTLSGWDLFCFSSYGALLLVLTHHELSSDLQGDQLFHAQYAHVHALKGLRLLSSRFPLLLDWKLSYLVQTVDLGILVLSALAFLALRKKNAVVQVLALGLAFLLIRGTLLALGGNVEIHPAFRLFPLWLSVTLLTVSNWSLRLPQLLAVPVLMVFVQRTLCRFVSPPLAWLGGCAVGTLPVLLHVATLVEPSIWSCFVLSTVFLVIAGAFDGPEPIADLNLVRLSSLLALGTLMRQPTFAGYLPLFLVGLYTTFRSRKSRASGSWNLTFWIFIPCLAMIPSLAAALILGTPASDSLGSGDSKLLQVLHAATSGVAWRAILQAIMAPPLFLLPFAFLPRHKKDYSSIILLVGFAALFFLFYSVSPELWGTGRYQAEYVVPFIIVGIYKGLWMVRKAQALGAGILVLLTIWNLATFKKLDSIHLPVDERKALAPLERGVLSQLVYPYREAMSAVKEAGLAGNLYSMGYVYGNFSEVLAGYTLGEYLSNFRLRESVQKKKHDVFSALNSHPEAKVVLISDHVDSPPGSNSIAKSLRSMGWAPWRKFYDPVHGSTIIGLIRE